MKLILKKCGDTTGFINWLESFKDLQKSLLIETDLVNQELISKAFPIDHTIVKYSKISLADAGLEVVNFRIPDNSDPTNEELETAYSLEEWNEKTTSRIKVGIFMILTRFIELVKTFSTADHTITIYFDEKLENGSKELHAQAIEFVSKTLTMRVQNCNVSEFEQLPDNVFFNGVNAIDNPMTFDITTDTIKNLSKISSVFSIDSKKDIIKFYTKKDPSNDKYALYALDYTNNTYDYMLGYIKSGEGVKSEILVYRNNFFVVAKEPGDFITLTLSANNNIKIRIESSDKSSTTIVAAVAQ